MAIKDQPRVIYNDDTCSLRVVEPPHDEDDLGNAVDYLASSQVDWLCWCLSSGTVAYAWASDVMESAFDLSVRDKGVEIFRKSNERNVMLTLHRNNVDYLPLLIDMAHRKNIGFFGSFRMNDAHQKSRPDGMLAGRFWQEHQDWRLWDVEDALSYYNATMDYSYPQVRQHITRAIREVAERYDVDGIELDFCRNPYTFPKQQAWSKRGILTKFVAGIRTMLNQIGQSKDKRLKLIIRVPFMERKRVAAGMDIKTWIQKKHLDVLVMSSLSNNYNDRIEPWQSMCSRHGVLFYPSIEAGPATNAAHNLVVQANPDDKIRWYRGMARNYLAQKPDGIYLFNYPCILFESEYTRAKWNRLTNLLGELGSEKTLRGNPARYLFWQDLPIYAESYRPPQHHQTIHFDVRDPAVRRRDAKVAITFRQVARRNPHEDFTYTQNPLLKKGYVHYLLNGKLIDSSYIRYSRKAAGPIASGFELEEHHLITITAPAGGMIQGENTLAFHIPKQPKEHDPYVYFYELMVDVG